LNPASYILQMGECRKAAHERQDNEDHQVVKLSLATASAVVSNGKSNKETLDKALDTYEHQEQEYDIQLWQAGAGESNAQLIGVC
jgi:hypothetical protein